MGPQKISMPGTGAPAAPSIGAALAAGATLPAAGAAAL